MGFLDRAVWSRKGVCMWESKRPARNTHSVTRLRISSQIYPELWKLWRPQKQKLHFSLSFFISPSDKGQMVIWCWLEFQNRPPSFHRIFFTPHLLVRAKRGQPHVPLVEQIHQDTFSASWLRNDLIAHMKPQRNLWSCMIWRTWTKLHFYSFSIIPCRWAGSVCFCCCNTMRFGFW